jgi:hypothetical protein
VNNRTSNGPDYDAIAPASPIRAIAYVDTEAMLIIVALAWMYVVLMAALAEGLAPQGSWLGALFTVLGWGVLPLSIVLYILATPARRRARRAAELRADEDRGGHAAGGPVAPEREEP